MGTRDFSYLGKCRPDSRYFANSWRRRMREPKFSIPHFLLRCKTTTTNSVWCTIHLFTDHEYWCKTHAHDPMLIGANTVWLIGDVCEFSDFVQKLRLWKYPGRKRDILWPVLRISSKEGSLSHCLKEVRMLQIHTNCTSLRCATPRPKNGESRTRLVRRRKTWRSSSCFRRTRIGGSIAYSKPRIPAVAWKTPRKTRRQTSTTYSCCVS